MIIPKSYEALSADLASEKILSKTLLGQKEAYMMLADGRKVELDAALVREAALRESLTDKRDEYNKLGDRYDALQQRLLTAGQRIGELESILGRLIKDCLASDFNEHWDSFISAESALKLAAEGEGS